MNPLIIFISESICVIIGIGIGWVAKTRKTVDYKRRWKEALALLQQQKIYTYQQSAFLETPDTIVVPSKTEEGYTEEEIEVIRKRLRNLPFDSDRESMEYERLKGGLSPVDDLTQLNFATTYRDMVKTRMRYGWDELGKPIR